MTTGHRIPSRRKNYSDCVSFRLDSESPLTPFLPKTTIVNSWTLVGKDFDLLTWTTKILKYLNQTTVPITDYG